jgi:hypothetical protein
MIMKRIGGGRGTFGSVPLIWGDANVAGRVTTALQETRMTAQRSHEEARAGQGTQTGRPNHRQPPRSVKFEADN